jgi:acyl-CoA dehydrogenase
MQQMMDSIISRSRRNIHPGRYGQLIIESANMEKVEDSVLNQMFDVYVRDFSRYAMALASKPSNTPEQRKACEKAYKYPVANTEEYEKVIKEHVYTLVDAYVQNP